MFKLVLSLSLLSVGTTAWCQRFDTTAPSIDCLAILQDKIQVQLEPFARLKNVGTSVSSSSMKLNDGKMHEVTTVTMQYGIDKSVYTAYCQGNASGPLAASVQMPEGTYTWRRQGAQWSQKRNM